MLLGKALDKEVIGYKNNISILAVPLGFTKSNQSTKLSKKLNASWNISGQDVPSNDNPLLLAFLAPNESGIVEITANISNPGLIFQEIAGKLDLNF